MRFIRTGVQESTPFLNTKPIEGSQASQWNSGPMRNAIHLWLLLGLSGPCWSVPVTDRYLWLLPYSSVNLSLTADANGKLRVNKTLQEEPRCWRLTPAANANFYYLTCAGYGGNRGLSIKDGKVYLAADRGLAWKLDEVNEFQYRFSSEQGQLHYDEKSGQATLVKDPDSLWNIWSRQQLNKTPDPGNYVRSDQAEFWKVQVDGLRGRSLPDPESSVVRRFRRGQVLRVDYGRGGSDEVAWNSVDKHGNTWIKVSTREGKPLNCYIRANPRWLAPINPKSPVP